jgi:hypothetical protein
MIKSIEHISAMTTPERLWIEDERPDGGACHVHNEPSEGVLKYGTPYILATPEALAASPEVQALVMAERGRCAARVRAEETEPLVAELARLRADYFSAKERLHNYDRAAIGGAA